MSAVAIALDQLWLIVVIAYGFVARVLTGPTLGQLVTRVVTPLLGVAPRPVPGPPKRFAQGIGAVLSVTAAVLAFGFHLPVAAYAVLGVSSPRPPPWKRSSRCVWAARSSPA
jgi:hypothetical protein